ncbi:MAG: hypothetical protein RLZZ611_906 [Cyanobacteriota bacterium]
MSDGLDKAYTAVERAYSEGGYAEALQLATELLPQVPAGHEGLLDHRLNLLIGHIQSWLGEPAAAAAAYAQVLATCPDPTYRDMASQGLARSGSAEPTTAAAADHGLADSSDGPASSAGGEEPTDVKLDLTASSSDSPATGRSVATGFATTTGNATSAGTPVAATPWLQELPDFEPEPEPIAVEPELITAITAAVPAAAATALDVAAAPRQFSDEEWADLNRCLLVVDLNANLS